MATAIKFAEAVLGVAVPQSPARTACHRGRCITCATGSKSPALAWIYAPIAGVAALTTTPFTQTNSIALVWNTQFGVPTLGHRRRHRDSDLAVIIGGIQSIGRAAEKLTPLKVGLYLVGGLIVIVTFASRIPDVLALVFREAFSTQAAVGTANGIGVMVAMRYGLARGIYANEAGYGTAAVAYGTAASHQPAQQGLNAVMEVFIVSFVTSTISAMVVLLTGAWQSGHDQHRGRRASRSTRACRWSAAGSSRSACFCSATPR